MKSGLYVVYTSLLTVSVLSSCVLFILVVSETSPPYDEPANVFGLRNVTKNSTYKTNGNLITDGIRDLPEKSPNHQLPNKKTLAETELTFIEGLSQNSAIANGLPDTGQPPILISLADTIKLDLRSVTENDSTYLNNASKLNGSQTLVTNAAEEKEIKTEATETIVVQARPMAEVKLEQEGYLATSTPPPKSDDTELDNKTEAKNVPEKQPHEDIPSFSEWTQKQLAEAEKLDTVLNHSSQPSHTNGNSNSKTNKLRSKNYANPACGAKVVAVNPEAGSASSILSPNRDEYMLNTCNSRIWFIVELCEPVQAQKVELANFELFSSSPKDFIVSFSDRFPTRDWTSFGQFTANNDKEVQSFDLYPHLFGKFIKVEMLSHYGSEHYCPISLFKVYGTSEFEVLEKEDAHADIEEDDEILGDVPDVPISDVEVSKNLFGSARDAVMSIMKKAAQVLVKGEAPKNNASQQVDSKKENRKDCCTPSHIIVCDNCSETMYNQVYDLISCHSNNLMKAVNQVFVHKTLRNTEICRPFGLDFRNKRIISFRNERASYMSAVLSNKYIAALCNLMAIIDKKVVLNSSYETELNVTSNLTLDKVSDIVVDEFNLNEIVQMPFNDEIKEQDTMPKVEKKVPIVDEAISNSEDKDRDIVAQASEPPEDTKYIEQQSMPSAMENTEIISEKNVKDGKENEDTLTVQPEPDIPQVDDILKSETVEANTDTILMDSSSNILTDKSQNTQINGEITDTLVTETENFLSELDQLISDQTTTHTTATPVINSQSPPQKESVFLRLSNRVKTLERNMSLSAQYLEELSRRYKKQVEEMQKSFEKTVLQLHEERKKTEERDQHNTKQLAKLQEQLFQISESMKILLDERDSWFGTITFFKFFVLQAIIISFAVYYIYRKPIPQAVPIETDRRKKKKENQGQKVRRKSVEGVSGHETPAGKKRRPSEEALHIARQSAEDLDDDLGEWQVARKSRRRKTSIPHRSEEEWMRHDSIGVLKENVIPLDEEEFIAPVPEPVDFDTVVLHKVNGGINNVNAKPAKIRRVSSPTFLKTALGRQSSRSTASSGTSGANPTLESGVPDSTVQENGRCKSEAGSIKNKKRSFKSIFKKVF